MAVGSPLRTPKCSKSPLTPNKEIFNDKMRELKMVKAQLENERYEKNMLEIEVKQNQDKAESLGEFKFFKLLEKFLNFFEKSKEF